MQEKRRPKTCKRCGADFEVLVTRSVCGNDPDFLTLRLGNEIKLEKKKKELTFGMSKYTLTTILQWNSKTKQGSVSAMRSDGWYAFGVDVSQQEMKKIGEDLSQFDNVVALMAVRIGSIVTSNVDAEFVEDRMAQEGMDVSKVSENFEDLSITEVEEERTGGGHSTGIKNFCLKNHDMVEMRSTIEAIEISGRSAAPEEEDINADFASGG